MDKIIRGEKVSYWKNNAKDNYSKTPISVLKYITILEEALDDSQKSSVIDGIISESEANGVLVECGCGEYQLAKIDIFNTKRPYCAVCNKWLDNGEQG